MLQYKYNNNNPGIRVVIYLFTGAHLHSHRSINNNFFKACSFSSRNTSDRYPQLVVLVRSIISLSLLLLTKFYSEGNARFRFGIRSIFSCYEKTIWIGRQLHQFRRAIELMSPGGQLSQVSNLIVGPSTYLHRCGKLGLETPVLYCNVKPPINSFFFLYMNTYGCDSQTALSRSEPSLSDRRRRARCSAALLLPEISIFVV